MKITQILMAEHTVFHNLFDHIEKTAPRLRTLAEVKSLAATLETLLHAHSQTEDELFVAPLEHCFEQLGHRETFHEEHDEIDETLLATQKSRAVKAARGLLLAAVVDWPCFWSFFWAGTIVVGVGCVGCWGAACSR